MSLISGWSPPSDPLYESSLATLPKAQLLAAQPQLLLVLAVQSSVRYAAMSDPSTPVGFASVFASNAPCGSDAEDRKSLQPYTVAVARITNAVPRSRGCFDLDIIVASSLKRPVR